MEPPISTCKGPSGTTSIFHNTNAACLDVRNFATDTYENLVKAGVIDPTKVVRTALQGAASVAGLLITTEAAISDVPEDKNSGGGMPDMGGMGGGMGGMGF